MSFVICFYLDQSKILSSVSGLNSNCDNNEESEFDGVDLNLTGVLFPTEVQSCCHHVCGQMKVAQQNLDTFWPDIPILTQLPDAQNSKYMRMYITDLC